ncbi:MAG: PilZ domain-containing protein [Deltaproteobacteria bacterium]|nr:PilZ domain-containing protein [Deltaproteobacteria bacterium]
MTLRVAGKLHQGRTTNVSRGGFAADMNEKVPVGAEIEVDLQLVFDDDAQSEPLRVPARIVWCTAVEEMFQVGISFKPIPADRAQVLAMFLRYLDDSGPKTKQPKGERSIDDQFR